MCSPQFHLIKSVRLGQEDCLTLVCHNPSETVEWNPLQPLVGILRCMYLFTLIRKQSLKYLSPCPTGWYSRCTGRDSSAPMHRCPTLVGFYGIIVTAIRPNKNIAFEIRAQFACEDAFESCVFASNKNTCACRAVRSDGLVVWWRVGIRIDRRIWYSTPAWFMLAYIFAGC